ncbi:MAG: hypothetical protein ACJ77N_12700 [Chloroflexota bacterium]
MVPLGVLAAGVVAVIASAALLRSMGTRFRIGRLLATASIITVAEARDLASRDVRRYVGVQGRIDSETDFEDAAHRPLVFRRTRWEVRGSRGWQTWDVERQSVPFEIHEGLDAIAIDADDLDEGLVVVPRESVGTAADLAADRPTDARPETPVRVVIDQLSAVEHAIALGVPRRHDGTVALGSGLGRPLVITTLERDEAMRVLAAGRTASVRAATVLLGVGVAGVLVGAVWLLVDAIR